MDGEPLISRPPSFSGVDTEPAVERMLKSPRVSWGPGTIVEAGGGIPVLFVTEVTPEPMDNEARLEAAMGPRLFGDASNVLSGRGGSAGSSDT